MATILLMYLAVGFKLKTIRPSPVTVTAGVLSVVAIVVLMISRNQLLAVMLVIAGILFYLPRPVIVKAGILLAVIVAGITLVVFSIDSDTQEKYLNIRLTEAFEGRLAQSGFGGSGGIDSLFGDKGVTRPFQSLGGAIDRWKGSVIFGTGLETAEGRPAPNYHNDWATVLASAGIIGLAAYAFLVILLGRLEWLLVIPFILPGMTNAFLFAPQHVVLVALLGGLVAGRKLRRRRTANESQVPVDRSPRPVLSRRTQTAVPVGESMGESE
ncbi:MAG: hypothetical protein IIC30_05910 [Chloroflexi bacterium]|nr:hypothetical protein [Chloroflexota bacterium]